MYQKHREEQKQKQDNAWSRFGFSPMEVNQFQRNSIGFSNYNTTGQSKKEGEH
jgi:hypothetical protein